ncbi:hypothetical protein CH063_07157 [Colletotrichum higginsianum]|uniref:C6 zinc finger domain-containing protein n=2 Tax=Colletotrichum higginsianum TaxID=80884 RepID=H1V556_COLHI|nr:C6 zinc finger domain-containing protein [Colletotrichum higginsianum IMI 349063]OBR15122.1 C6 zinc finger domain-containing protein [Colletotrichum higginsianum IMI 349063]TID04489.1 hypothetical protein CH35J_003053 [Colletotrichum higginsianum]CCF35358.1 hypothetical protein CH063_07157 [Colletotrichum higginsianum]
MRQTLRRSCAACAKSKHSCDLRTPRCSRCVKRRVLCVYANEPLTAGPAAAAAASGPSTALGAGTSTSTSKSESASESASPSPPSPSPSSRRSSGPPLDGSGALTNYRFASLDPFDSYPQTRLPREQVQRLIHSFLHKIAFEYYPLDLSATSNPFLVSWWPLALGDPALFHVSLQTACLDEELLAQKGFQSSEILMADSVALLRRKVQDTSLAIQDGTMNSVITLAAIEFGKGNTAVSDMHVDGVKKLVDMRGGINAVRQTSPLTARMVSWVSMIVTGRPQFDTQDDTGIGDGVPPPPEWQSDPAASREELTGLDNLETDYEVRNVLSRLRSISRRANRGVPLAPTRLHDLACFVIHRLLLSTPEEKDSPACPPGPECLRYAIILYMFLIQGPTYYSHAVIFNTILGRFVADFERLASTPHVYDDLGVWLLTIGMAAANGTGHYEWLTGVARDVAVAKQLTCWGDALGHARGFLWLETHHGDSVFRPHWDALLGVSVQPRFGYPLLPVA